MKKENGIVLAIVSIGTLIVSVFTICLMFNFNKKANERIKTLEEKVSTIEKYFEPAEPPEYDVSDFKEISAKDISKESKGKTMVIYIGRSSCGYCAMYLPVLREVQEKYDYQTYYIDIAKIIDYTGTADILDQESNDILINLPTVAGYEDFMTEFGTTPMTIIVKDNKIHAAILGYVEAATLEAKLEEAGFSN